MADRCPGRGAGQGGPAGVAEQVQHPDGPARGPDLAPVPGPVHRLLGEHAGVLEAGGADDQGQPVLPFAAVDLPALGQGAAVLPAAPALVGAVVHGVGPGPEGALGLALPDHLGVGPDQQGRPPPFQPVAPGGVQ